MISNSLDSTTPTQTFTKTSPGSDPNSQISRVSTPRYSMFATTPVYQIDGEIQFGLMRPQVQPDVTDQAFTVTQVTANRLDLISTQVYDTPQLGWLIGQVNNIVDPWNDLPQGTVLRVPLRSRLTLPGL